MICRRLTFLQVYVGGANEVIDLMKQGTSNRSIAATKVYWIAFNC